MWVVLILSHLVSALRERSAPTANGEPVEVSGPVLVERFPKLGSTSGFQLERLVHEGRQLGLVRASPRLARTTPQRELSCYQSVATDLLRQRPGRAPGAPRARAPKPTKRVCGSERQRQRRQASKEAKTIRAAQATVAREA